MTSSFAFTLCLVALVSSVSAVRRGAESIATDQEGGSTCCCYSDAGDCASKSSRQGQTISVPSSAEPYCCKLRKGTGCEYHKKKYGTPLAEILGETGTVHESMCTFDVVAPSEPVPDEEPVKPPAEEPKDPVEELTDGNDPVPPVENAVDESEEDELSSPAASVPEGEKTPATPAEELEDANDLAPPVEQDDDEGAGPGKGAAAGTPPATPAAARVTDLTGVFLRGRYAKVSLDGTTYTCCCSVESNSLKCEILDVNTAEKAISWKGGCGGLKGNGWHSYNNMGSKYASVPNIGDCRVETNELAEKLLIGHLME